MTERPVDLLHPGLSGGSLSAGGDIGGGVVVSMERVVRALCAVVALTAAVSCSTADEPESTRDWPADHCPQPSREDQAVAIDWVSFIVVDGTTYSTDYSPGSVIGQEQVGDVVASVRCRIEDVVFDPEFVPREGDAAYLPIGTEVHAVVGFPETTCLAALEGGTWRVFEADESTAEVDRQSSAR